MIKDIDENYSIDECGNVYSRPRATTPGGKLKQYLGKRGYYVVNFSPGKNSQAVHRLVAKAFLPEVEGKPYVNHKDGDKTNNHVTNLEWCSAKENSKHAFDSGLTPTPPNYLGESSPQAKLKTADVAWARLVYQPRHPLYSYAALGRKFGVETSVMRNAIIGKTWKHLE